ncbi:uncharacterized protein LOC127603793 [Hippocampus zosterae]|uniref:uncharacterized protein LOC127603793 n=1 Tax=Hippocampus zosterae TaxID=109293 RepID=UPI00223E143A|nr:uncharacterized protein LOC127603793 [Hippocampus zosterae]
MWCYQKPGFEALLVAALQRQQQHRQFCDTLLRAEGVSVPAHSCVLSAISPQLSTALSSSPAPPAGREHLLEFGTVGARTLLHVVRLLYSGEMAGEGESEKHEAVWAAAKLGILGLVEVTRKQGQGPAGTEVGVQTDPVELSEKEFVCWRGEVRAGRAVIWNETLSSGTKDALTETEAMQASSTSSCKSVPAYETIDMAQLKRLGQADNHAVLPNVPAPLIYLLDEAQNLQTSLVAEHSDTPRVVDSQSYLFSNPQAEARRLEGERAEPEQFHDDIPGFINHFFNPNSEEAFHTGRTKKKPPGRAKRRGGGERPARTPQARRGGRRRGGWTQTVDVQEVGVSRQHKSLLQRCGMATSSRTGQGGGTTGRKLHLNTRHALGLLCSPQRRGRWPKVWDFCPSEQSHKLMKAGDNMKRHRRNETPQDTQSPPCPKTKSSSKHQPVTVIRHYLLRSRCKATGTTDQPDLEKVWSQLDQPVSKRGRTKKTARLPCEVDGDALEVVEDRCKNNATVEMAAARAAKRRTQPEEKTRDFSSEAKRKRLEPNVLLPVKLSVDPTVLANTGDIACKEETRVVEYNKDLDTMNAEVSLGTQSEEEDIDVMGALGPIPDPVSITWSLSSESEEKEEADEEIDIVGRADLTSSPVAFAVSNAVNSLCHGEVHRR